MPPVLRKSDASDAVIVGLNADPSAMVCKRSSTADVASPTLLTAETIGFENNSPGFDVILSINVLEMSDNPDTDAGGVGNPGIDGILLKSRENAIEILLIHKIHQESQERPTNHNLLDPETS
jgi:hypothetical protein